MRRSNRTGSDPVASAALARAPAALPSVTSQTKHMNPAALVQKMLWTDDMEAFLIKAWQKIVQPTGGKGKNVWKLVAEAMEQNFVGCGATDSACKNRFASLKTDYSLYNQMVSETSGFGRTMRDLAEPDVWAEFVQHFPRAAHFRSQPFTHFQLMSEVVGDESYTGRNIISPESLLKKRSASAAIDLGHPTNGQGILHVNPVDEAPILEGEAEGEDEGEKLQDKDTKTSSVTMAKSESKTDLRQDFVSRGAWKKPKKPDMATTLAKSLRESLDVVFNSPNISAPGTIQDTPIIRAVKYFQNSCFAEDKAVLWRLIAAVKNDPVHGEIILSLNDDLKDDYIRSVVLK